MIVFILNLEQVTLYMYSTRRPSRYLYKQKPSTSSLMVTPLTCVLFRSRAAGASAHGQLVERRRLEQRRSGAGGLLGSQGGGRRSATGRQLGLRLGHYRDGHLVEHRAAPRRWTSQAGSHLLDNYSYYCVCPVNIVPLRYEYCNNSLFSWLWLACCCPYCLLSLAVGIR